MNEQNLQQNMPQNMPNMNQGKTPIIMSSEPARKKFMENMMKLQNYESQYQVPTITEKPKETKPVQFNA